MNDFVAPNITKISYCVGADNAPDVKNITISQDMLLPSVQDGDMVTFFAKNLTIDAGATLTTENRCKGMRIICFGDCTISGKISMTGRGAFAAGEDVTIDIATQSLFTVKFPAELRAIDIYLKNFFNPASEFSDMPESIRPVIEKETLTGQSLGTVPAVGGAGGTAPSNAGGTAGAAGTNRAAGGGGSGGSYISAGYAGAGGIGTAFSGGPGGGGAASNTTGYHAYASSGANDGGAGGYGAVNMASTAYAQAAGGGAGNPGGAGANRLTGVGNPGSVGTGGLLILIVLGNLTINAGGTIESKGSTGGSTSSATYAAGGGGSGGGSINIAYGGLYANAGTITSSGGAGGSSTRTGGAGGAGCITIEQLST
jgi:hypothetical protein